ncbi:MAG: hypothetical protein ACFCD0_25905 [Gemmataceae bacterium]
MKKQDGPGPITSKAVSTADHGLMPVATIHRPSGPKTQPTTRVTLRSRGHDDNKSRDRNDKGVGPKEGLTQSETKAQV